MVSKENAGQHSARVAKAASGAQGCHRTSLASRSRQGILPLPSTPKATAGVRCPVVGSSAQESDGAIGEAPAKMVKGMEYLSHEEMLEEG